MHVLCALVNVVETDTEFLLSIPFIKLKMCLGGQLTSTFKVKHLAFFTACSCCVILFGL